MHQLQTVDVDTLLYGPFEKPSFVVDGLIPMGLSLFCGSQKIGKSWLMLKLCLCVSQGIPLWDMQTLVDDVLYLCLEDTFSRIQDRLFRLTDEASRRLHFAVASCKLSDGLIMQLEDYFKVHPDSRLIVINTLQKIRTASKDNAGANDYDDISLLKDFADRHSISVVVVHYICKQNNSDVFNKVRWYNKVVTPNRKYIIYSINEKEGVILCQKRKLMSRNSKRRLCVCIWRRDAT